MHDVEFLLDEMLRVGTRCIVSFPNLGFHEHRRRLAEEGRAPLFDHGKGKEEWYSTSDVRFLSLADFEDFCAKKNFRIHDCVPLKKCPGKTERKRGCGDSRRE